MLHASRVLISHLSNGRVSDESFITALLGEAEVDMLAHREALEAPVERAQGREDPGGGSAREKRLEVARRALAQATSVSAQRLEAAVEFAAWAALPRRGGGPKAEPTLRRLEASAVPVSPVLLDRAVRELACERGRREVIASELALRFLERRLWRALGFRSLKAYLERRPSLCLSTLEHQATLGRHLRRYPSLARALELGTLGKEAALLVGRVLGRRASEAHAAAWIARARARTYRCLREEVSCSLIALSFDSKASRMPPGLEELEAAADFERQVQSGQLFRSLLGPRNLGPQTSVTLASMVHSANSRGGRPPPLRLRLSDELFGHWRKLEDEFRELVGPKTSFIAFVCLRLWSAWLPFLETWDDKWKDVYRRDRHRCQNPVCDRRDVTPHHVVFQAHGGGDESENVISLCSWCHLEGVHRGRIRVEGQTSELRWHIGREAVLDVRGREVQDR